MTVSGATMIDAALEYARIGWHVFPLYSIEDGHCDCFRKEACDRSPGKHPRTQNGVLDASADPETIRRWWGMWPQANIGIACGPSGIVAIDIDPRHDGEASYRKLVKQYGKGLSQTVCANTGGGGLHLIFAAPRGTVIGNVVASNMKNPPLGPGVDVRGMGGYIVAAPSSHESGNAYSWDGNDSPFEREPALLPHALYDLLTVEDRRDPQGDYDTLDTTAILQGVPEGGRDWELFRLASKLRGAGVPIDWAYQLVGEAASRCVPPFRDWRAKVDSAYSRYPDGSAPAEPTVSIDWTRTETVDEETGEIVRAAPAGRVLLDHVIREGMPPIDYLEDDIVVRGAVHMLYGEPESGKTVFAAHWMRNAVQRGQRVIFVDEESGPYKIADFFRDMGLEAVDNLLYYFPFTGIDMESVTAFLEYADELEPALVVFDSLTDMLASAGLDENSGIEVTKWMLAVPQRLARSAYAPAVVLVDHVTKEAANTKYSVASRAKKAKSDVLWLVEKQGDFDRSKTAPVDLYRHKNRPGVLPPSHHFIVGGREGELVVERFSISQHGITSLSVSAQKILTAIGAQTLQVSEIAASTALAKRTVNYHLRDLLEARLVEKGTKNGYDAYTVIAQLRDESTQLRDAPTNESIAQKPPLIGGIARLRDGVTGPSQKKGSWIDDYYGD